VIGKGADVVNLNGISGHVLLGKGSTGWRFTAASWPAILSATDMTWFPSAATASIGATTVAQIQEALIAIQPAAIKTGGRAALWQRLQWAILERSLKGLTTDDDDEKALVKVTTV